MRFIVGVERGTSLEAVAERIAAQGYDTTSRHGDIHALEMRLAARFAERARVSVSGIEGVRYVEAVRSVRAADSPSDPYYPEQSSHLSSVNASQAWDIEKGRADVVVAVIDTGMDVLHPDLQPNVWVNPREIANNNADDDFNGCVDDINGCAFVTDSLPGCQNVTNGFVRDDIGHGTFVAGIIAAPANGRGIVGVARGVRVMAVKVLDCYGSGDSVAVARGISYAVRNGAAVVNVSLGGLDDAAVVYDAVAEAQAANVLIVAAAGNDGSSSLAFPARIPAVLAVGATQTGGGARAPFTNYGMGMDVVAPGMEIWGTVPSARCYQFLPCSGPEPYGAADGTSFSAPQVAGLAALMLSQDRSLTPLEISAIIRATATPLPDAGAPGWAGAGRINMLASLQALRAGVPPGEPCTIATVTSGETFTCTSGRSVRMLQIEAPDAGQCGGEWARAALEHIFLTPGRTVSLQYDVARTDAQGRVLAAPVWRGNDGADYNLSIVMLFVGLARVSEVGAGNIFFREWGAASEVWAAAAGWNMWAPGKPFTGGC